METVITPKDRIKREARKIRPYRHAIIRLIKPTAGSLSYQYERNEFGEGLIAATSDGIGSYEISLNTSSFSNINNVFVEAQIAHTVLTLPICTSYFSTAARSNIVVIIFDVNTFFPADIEGEILVTIKEFYA